MRIAIMQGRLLPPEDGLYQFFPRYGWSLEFSAARAAGLDAIEWIYDQRGEDCNPLATDHGIEEMRLLSENYGVQVVSLCADYFMDRPFVRASAAQFAELELRLDWLMTRCQRMGIERLVLPFVNAGRIETAAHRRTVIELLRRTLPRAKKLGVEIHLETSLDPQAFGALLDELPHSMLKANYDSGNSASLGYNVREELAAYGGRIGSVHISDRVRGGGTVPLGRGGADIPTLLQGLAELEYAGDYVLEVARGVAGHETDWSRQNHQWVLERLDAACLAEQGSVL